MVSCKFTSEVIVAPKLLSLPEPSKTLAAFVELIRLSLSGFIIILGMWGEEYLFVLVTLARRLASSIDSL